MNILNMDDCSLEIDKFEDQFFPDYKMNYKNVDIADIVLPTTIIFTLDKGSSEL